MKSQLDQIALKVVASISSPHEADIVVIPVFQDSGLPKVAKALDDMLGKVVSKGIELEKFDAESDKSLWIRPTDKKMPGVLLVVVGKSSELDRGHIREVYCTAAKSCTSKKAEKVAIIRSGDKKLDLHLDAALEGFLISLYEYDAPKQKRDTKKKIKLISLICENTSQVKETEALVKQVRIYTKATYFARDLVNGPANVVNPSSMAKASQVVAKEGGLKLKIFEMDELKKMGMNLILAVGMGSIEKPRLVHLEYKPKGKAKKTVAIVGKGVTFDSGGLSLKTPSTFMYGMKCDMAGAGAALAIASALPDLNLPVHVHILFPLVENMPSDRSVKPGDVFVGYNGKSVEIENTDAEGRLVLADALAYADKHLKPDFMIDMATLTGACVVALGEEIAAMMGTCQATIDALGKISKITGEKMWQLPFEKKYFSGMKSDVADMKNVAGKYAGSITGGLFLNEFVEKTHWVHLDIAGPAFADSPNSLGVRGATGFPVRTILELLKTYA